MRYVGIRGGAATGVAGDAGDAVGVEGAAAAGQGAALARGLAGSPVTPGSGRERTDRDWAAGIGLMTGSAVIAQSGAAIAAQAFPVLGPLGVVAVRQWVACGVMLAGARPRVRQFTARQWRPVLVLALDYILMNTTLYMAIQRIGLGLAVTLEFLGPLSVALLASRKAVDYGCAVLAGAAAVVLARPQPSTDYIGIGLAVAAAAGWAGYIMTSRVIGERFTGSQAQAAAISISALLYLPVGVAALASRPVTLVALARAAAAGIGCTVVPMICDGPALRRVPAHFYSVFMSVNPLLAAFFGLVVLGQSLSPLDWLAIVAIVTANAISIASHAS
jgi:inner membrane transporter RhtA